ncbi:MAG: aspartate 1-decarboxylase [Cycloclasticus pugetii]|jgi:aspartate 1-decarboxylase|uniref:Aspartate 1-decarboxylase n=2 Tax=Cycloclasticus TaxID=34067 RepID=S5TZT3_9GAMM|nr:MULTISPECIES: aspartate 1-decarboxylase [Cycloclasticus]AFT66464.1 Aspartate 1-decarboxylase alpha chain [Cycloclasticus sp. P1]AGS40533.1 Aspartate 1-decarboxylase [Cycloclasticus zancles 78-ME]ATI03962.1 aspartate 1-decarboxylase [Cycloclasticus sp. PY97N]EPD14400.1 aspartate alpha-decarboxylase [Cycloclasticus pugetii]MBV1898713.1 aspartate 1-decarboxylase [Cycloclasticus sp.]
MRSTMLQTKLHRATVTHSELHYEGSCAIDGSLLDLSGIREYQQIDIYNVNNGERFTTYAIRAEDNSGIISVNGAAARRATEGDILIICAYSEYSEAELATFKPCLVYLDDNNGVKETKNAIPVQAA